MFAEERLNEILKILNREEKVKVKELSLLFGVSEDCIRKDLNKLEKEGKLQRAYGGGILPRKTAENITLSSRKNENLDVKKKIALKAFQLINERETIFLDISTINILLAQLIAKSPMKLTVVTNMIEVVKAFEKCENIKTICTGGIYNKEVDGFTGSETINIIRKYRFDKAFIGSCGVNVFDKGVTTLEIEDGNTKRAIMDSAKAVYLPMENKKFHYDAFYRFAFLEDIRGIITEERPTEKIGALLNKNDVELI